VLGVCPIDLVSDGEYEKPEFFSCFPSMRFALEGKKIFRFHIFPVVLAGEMASAPGAVDHLADVRATRANRIAKKSKNGYVGHIASFMIWLSRNMPDRLVPSVRMSLAKELENDKTKRQKPTKDWIKTYCSIDVEHREWPLVDSFSADDFAAYLNARKKENITPSYLQNLKSGIRHLFILWRKRAVYEAYGADLSDFMSGAKKELAQARQDGAAKVREGKEPMQFSLYAFFGKYLLQTAHNDATFARTFMILCWNLVCRSKNAETIRMAHIIWQNDALGIVFAKQKNDQEGDNTDYRSIYANPRCPHICPILALAMYFLCTEFSPSGTTDLFPGESDSQASRYSQFMHRTYRIDAVQAELKHRGITINELGTHSVRKGAATYCASGSTDCPAITAIQLRAGWRLEGVTGRYLRFAAAGDQHVGRTVTGLDPMSPDFAILPPFFAERTAAVTQAINVSFPNAPDKLKETLEFCLASLVYHEAWMRNTMPSNHPVFASPLWRSEFMSQLRPLVQCRTYKEGDRIKPTGITASSTLIGNVHRLTSLIGELPTMIEMIPGRVVEGVTGILEARALAAQAVTPASLEEAINRVFAPIQAQVAQLAERLANPVLPPRPPVPQPYVPPRLL
jgi:integrase